MSPRFHHEDTAREPEAVTDLFAQLGVRFSFDPAGPSFSYRETRDGDESLTVARLSMGGPFSTWGDTEVFGVVEVRGARYDWSTSDEQGSGLGGPVLFRPDHPALVVAGPLEATNVYRTAGVLQEIADTVYGTEGAPVAFASSQPADPALGHYWSGLTRWAAETSASEAFAEPVVRADLTRRLAVGMLECFPLTGTANCAPCRWPPRAAAIGSPWRSSRTTPSCPSPSRTPPGPRTPPPPPWSGPSVPTTPWA